MNHDFSIPNLSCGHCVRAVTEALKAVDAASEVKADPATKRVEVHSALPRQAVVQALTEAGYAPA
jgi:copper chaperone